MNRVLCVCETGLRAGSELDECAVANMRNGNYQVEAEATNLMMSSTTKHISCCIFSRPTQILFFFFRTLLRGCVIYKPDGVVFVANHLVSNASFLSLDDLDLLG